MTTGPSPTERAVIAVRRRSVVLAASPPLRARDEGWVVVPEVVRDEGVTALAGVFARRAALGLQTGGDCEPGSPSTPAGSASPAGSGRREFVAPVTAPRLGWVGADPPRAPPSRPRGWRGAEQGAAIRAASVAWALAADRSSRSCPMPVATAGATIAGRSGKPLVSDERLAVARAGSTGRALGEKVVSREGCGECRGCRPPDPAHPDDSPGTHKCFAIARGAEESDFDCLLARNSRRIPASSALHLAPPSTAACVLGLLGQASPRSHGIGWSATQGARAGLVGGVEASNVVGLV